MIINIKPYDGTPGAIVEISKKALVKELKNEITKSLQIPGPQQRLFFFGKELQEDVSLLDYKIKEGGTVYMMVSTNRTTITQEIVDIKHEPCEEIIETVLTDVKSLYYNIGDSVDVQLNDTGAWYEGTVTKIYVENTDDERNISEEDIIFRIKSDTHILPSFELDVKFQEIRPRSYFIYKFSELTPGSTVLANYNLENKKSRGLWYNFKITQLTRTEVSGTVVAGEASIEDCNIFFKQEILRIETAELLDTRREIQTTFTPRKYPYKCPTCRDDIKTRCKDCGCKICSGKEHFDKILLCDECDDEYHLYCLTPPLDAVPSGDWYCPDCKVDNNEIVQRGEVKLTKKQKNMPNKTSKSKRDWGKGKGCAGRSSICTIVLKDHFGPIPNVDVGTSWLYRVQASEAGVHRPIVSGIHGKVEIGAYSIVLSGGYEDDIDGGEEFIYTGSGGRDLTGNKRVNKQSADQVLTKSNKALAMSCNVQFNEQGGVAKNWRDGKPVRVIRSYKAKKHSKYAPEKGIRYDGIYKVVKYYPERGKSGFIVWKYLLRRDDPAPAPWKKNAPKFDIIYPDEDKKGKRKASTDLTDGLDRAKKSALVYELPIDIKRLIELDKINKKDWITCSNELENGKSSYQAKVEETFKCPVCQFLIYDPVTLECKHHVCKHCLEQSFSNEFPTCSFCRHKIDKKLAIKINQNLSEALKLLFPGYMPA